MKMSSPRRLHPITILIDLLKTLKELLIPLIVFIVFGSKSMMTGLLTLAGICFVVGIILFTAFLSWYRYSYRLEEDEIRIEYGVFVRKERYIPFERIQSLDFSEGIFHRLFGLVKVKIETAGGGAEADAQLTAITKEEAKEIEKILQEARNKKVEKAEDASCEIKQNEEMIYQITMKELILLASTSGGVGVVISAVFAFLSQFDEVIPYEKIFAGLEDLIKSGFIFFTIVVFFGFLFAWAIAVIGMMLKYAFFTLKKVDNDLVITRGLIEKKQITIPLKRIQGLRISENMIRQPFGYATVMVESAGGSLSDNEDSKVVILPMIKKERIKGLIESNIEGFVLTDTWNRAPKRSLKRYIFRGTIWLLPVSIGLIIFLKSWGLLSLFLFPPAIFWAYLKYKDAGWNIEGNQLTLSFRGLVKHTQYMQKNKIQSLKRKESYFQRRVDLATIEATIKSGIGASGGTVVDLEKDDVLTIYKWFLRDKRFDTN